MLGINSKLIRGFPVILHIITVGIQAILHDLRVFTLAPLMSSCPCIPMFHYA